MRSIVRGVSLAGALFVPAVAAQAADGVLLVTKTTIDSGAPATNQVHIESKRMRAESSVVRSCITRSNSCSSSLNHSS